MRKQKHTEYRGYREPKNRLAAYEARLAPTRAAKRRLPRLETMERTMDTLPSEAL
jgi:hypothetical protein